LSLYSFLVTRCFDDCINDFHSDTLSTKERECTRRCTSKMLKLTNRIGQQMAEKQMDPAAAMAANPGKPT
jgi:import inner membrane translocase subunit TIM9